MGYFSRIANTAFKDNPNGNGWIYYPNGTSGKGRVVTNEKYKKMLFIFHKYSFISLVFIGIIYGSYFYNHGVDIQGIIVISVFLSIMYLTQFLLTRNLPLSDIKLTHNEVMLKAHKDSKMWRQNLHYILSFAAILLGIFTPWVANKPLIEVYDLVLMLICLGIAGIAAGLYTHKYIKSNKALVRDAGKKPPAPHS